MKYCCLKLSRKHGLMNYIKMSVVDYKHRKGKLSGDYK
jgi:hypothetical protein